MLFVVLEYLRVLDVSGLEPGTPKGEANNLSQPWKRWKRAFNLYVTGKDVSNDAQKRALLLHVLGMDVKELYFTLTGEVLKQPFRCLMIILFPSNVRTCSA